jgi:peptide deformylase
MGDNVLRQKAKEIQIFDEKLKNLSEEMIDIMHNSDGIGLAAPQVGISIRMLVTDISPVEKGFSEMVFVNPVILENWGNCTLEEGCLSIPGIREEVERPEEILLKYQTIDGEEKTEKFNGWMARVLQHEIDHLEGVLFVDYLSPVKQKLVMNQYSNA